jgi:hypothetical protein
MKTVSVRDFYHNANLVVFVTFVSFRKTNCRF